MLTENEETTFLSMQRKNAHTHTHTYTYPYNYELDDQLSSRLH